MLPRGATTPLRGHRSQSHAPSDDANAPPPRFVPHVVAGAWLKVRAIPLLAEGTIDRGALVSGLADESKNRPPGDSVPVGPAEDNLWAKQLGPNRWPHGIGLHSERSKPGAYCLEPGLFPIS